MIGKWNNDNCILALAPYSWSRGNGRSNQNTGNIPSYPNGDYQPCSLENMAATGGYLYKNGCIRLEGGNDYVALGYSTAFTNANELSLEFWIPYVIDAVNHQWLYSEGEDNNNYMAVVLRNLNMPRIIFSVAAALDYADSNVALTAGLLHVVFVKDGAALRIYTNGAEVAAYSNQDNYALGNKDYAGNSVMGALKRAVLAGYSIVDYYWFGVYNTTLTPARIATNYSLGAHMGLRGSNSGNVMRLYPLGTPAQKPKTGISMGMSI